MLRVELGLGQTIRVGMRRLEKGDLHPPGMEQGGYHARNGLNHWPGKEGRAKGNKDPKEKS